MSVLSWPNFVLGTFGYLEETSTPIDALGVYKSGDGDLILSVGATNLSEAYGKLDFRLVIIFESITLAPTTSMCV